MAVKIPSKLHTMSPTFQKAWYKRNKMELPPHLTGSVKQASKEVKPSERVKKLQTKSLQAYGATKGLKVGGEHGSGEMKDTIAPLTRDQHSKVQAAARAAKAAEKPAAKKTPLTKSQRMAAIAAAVRKAQSKHDVPTMEPDDEGHDDLRDVHQSLHIKKGAYSEAVDRMALIKQMAAKNKMNKPVALTKKPGTVRKAVTTHKHFAFFGDLDYAGKDKKKQGANRFEELEQVDEMDKSQRSSSRGAEGLATGTKATPATVKKTAADALKILKKKLNPVKEEVEQIEEASPMIKPPTNRFDKKSDAFAHAEKHGGRVYKQTYTDSKGQQTVSYSVKKEEVEMNEASKAEAEKLLGGPVKTRTGTEPKGKLPLGFRQARNLARKAMKTGKTVTESTTEVNEMSSHGKALAKAIMAKQSKRPIAQQMGEAIKDQADVGEYDYEGDMAKSQLRSIMTNAKRMHDMLEDNTNLPEWVQSKITLAEDYIVTAANYMEGEMNEEALAELAASLDEEIELFEKAPPGSKYERMVKHIKKGYAKGGLTDKERSIAYATAWKAHNKANEEVEQVDEANMRFDPEAAARPKSSDVKNFQMRNTNRRASAASKKYIRRMTKLGGLGPNQTKKDTEAHMKAHFGEEVEQVEEKYENNPLHSMPRPNKAVGLKPSQLAKKPVTAEGADDWKKAFAKVAKRNLNQDTAQVKQKVKKLEPVDVAEGSVPTTPKEKDLAAHHGDPNKITYGDVIKARLKSAAAKKMGK